MVPPGIDVLNVQIGRFSKRRNSVPRRHPIPCDEIHLADLFSVGAWRRLDNSGPLLYASSGVAMELTLDGDPIVVEPVGLEYR